MEFLQLSPLHDAKIKSIREMWVGKARFVLQPIFQRKALSEGTGNSGSPISPDISCSKQYFDKGSGRFLRKMSLLLENAKICSEKGTITYDNFFSL